MSVVPRLRAANQAYASTFANARLPVHPARRVAVVTCMDARLDPAKFLGLADGDAHVIRNAGGLVTDDALRSLIISHWLLGTREAVIVGHEACGMVSFSNDELQQTLLEWTGHDAGSIDFLAFDDLDEAVRASMQRVQECPFLPGAYGVTGFVYDVGTGVIRPVPGD